LDILLVAVGAIAGTIARYRIGRRFGAGTFFVNITGAFLLGIFVGAGFKSGKWYLLVADGFLGAFTTFSAYMLESHQMFAAKKHWPAIRYLVGTAVAGIVLFLAGFVSITFLTSHLL
jgi:CrcB protein